MVRFFYSNEIDAVDWKIRKFCFDNDLPPYRFDSSSTFDDIEKKIFQLDVFSSEKNELYIIDFSKLGTGKESVNFLSKLVNSQKQIILFYKGNYLDKRLSDKNGIIVQRIRPFSWQDKKEIVSFFLRQNNVKISEQDIEYMCLNLLANHHFIENEISKISLLKKNFSIVALNIKHILFDCFNANVFKIVDFWLQRNYKNLLKTLNETTYNSSQTQWIIQIFITRLIQIKMFILAVENGVDETTIANNLQLSFFQQKIYKNLYLSKKKIDSINKILVKLWNLEIGIKTNEINSFFSFVKILLDDRYDKW